MTQVYDKDGNPIVSTVAVYDRDGNPIQTQNVPRGAAPDSRTTGEVVQDQAAHVLRGIVGSDLAEHPVDTLKRLGASAVAHPLDTAWEVAKGIVSAPVTVPYNLGKTVLKAAQEGNWGDPASPAWTTAANAAGQSLSAAPVLAGDVGAIAGVAKFATAGVPQRLIGSLLKPTKSSLEFGADPIKSFLDAKVMGPTLEATSKNLESALADTESKLKTAVTGATGTSDASTAFRQGIADAQRQALLDGKPALARQLNAMVSNRLMEIESKYGTTQLTAEQLLDVKRDLKKAIAFTEDPTEASLNNAKMGIYRQVDQAMDGLTGNATKAINEHYSGLISASELMDTAVRKAISARLVPSNVMHLPIWAVEKFFPETAAKTIGAQAIRSLPAPSAADALSRLGVGGGINAAKQP